jgi:hypothetical protein
MPWWMSNSSRSATCTNCKLVRSRSGFRFLPPPTSARTEPSRIRPAVGKGAYPKQVAKAQAKEDKEKEKIKSLKRARPPPNDVKEFLKQNGVRPSNIPNAHSKFKRVPIAGETGRVHSLSKLKEHVGPMEDLPIWFFTIVILQLRYHPHFWR